MSLNFKKASSRQKSSNKSSKKTYELLPDGNYPIVVDKGEQYTASTGTPMLKVQFSVLNGKFENRKLWHQFPLTEKALGYVTRFLQATGSELSEQDDVEVEDLIEDITGAKLVGYVTSEQLQKGPVNIIDKFHKFTKQSPQPELVVNTPSEEDDIFS